MGFKKVTSAVLKSVNDNGKLYCYYLDIVDVFGKQNEWYFKNKENFFKIEPININSEELLRKFKMIQFKVEGTAPIDDFVDWILNKLSRKG